MATQLSRNFGEQGNQRKFTISVWVKRSKLGAAQSIMGSGGSSAYATHMYFDNNDRIDFWNYFNSAYQGRKITNRKFRDTNAWYHIVMAVDTTSSQSTAADRMKIYVNGVRETSFSTSSNPNQDQTFEIGHNGTHYIGGYGTGANFEGYMSHFHYCDGYQYQASDFGETDSTTGEWKIKTTPNVQYGTTGHFILKDGNSVTDQSGLTHNWTVANGTLTKTEDNPSHIFATLNPLVYESRDNTFSNGNNTITGGGSDSWTNKYGTSTIAPNSGKYYVEAKLITKVSSQAILGLISTSKALSGSLKDIGVFALETEGRLTGSGNNIQTGLTAFSNGDIAGLAFDATNGTAQFYRNGSTYGNALSSIPSDTYYIATTTYPSGGVINFNFGNGYFGTTAVATNSGNGYQDADGNGIFNYTVPTNYRALCTKGLNQ